MTPFSSVAPLIHVKTIGSGKPVVLLHGFLEDHAIWNTIYPDLVNEGCQCILIDLPCHGWSRYEGEICTMEQMAQSVFHFLKSEKITNPFVFGHSMGGWYASRWSVKAGEVWIKRIMIVTVMGMAIKLWFF